MTEEQTDDKLHIQVDANLMNVQQGDVLALRFPTDMSVEVRTEMLKRIQDMFTVNGVDIPVIALPKRIDVVMLKKDDDISEFCDHVEEFRIDTAKQKYICTSCEKEFTREEMHDIIQGVEGVASDAETEE